LSSAIFENKILPLVERKERSIILPQKNTCHENWFIISRFVFFRPFWILDQHLHVPNFDECFHRFFPEINARIGAVIVILGLPGFLRLVITKEFNSSFLEWCLIVWYQLMSKTRNFIRLLTAASLWRCHWNKWMRTKLETFGDAFSGVSTCTPLMKELQRPHWQLDHNRYSKKSQTKQKIKQYKNKTKHLT
jgi:hypothetical protein